MNRREFIAGLGAAATGPLTARAQQGDRVRRIGVLIGFDENHLDVKEWLSGLIRELAGLGWISGSRLRIDTRWAAGNMDRMQAAAKELVSLQPDVLLSASTPATGALAHETKTIPIVFALVNDPIGSGFAATLARPGGNITGFGWMEGSVAGVWLELLAQMAPRHPAGSHDVQSRHGALCEVVFPAVIRGRSSVARYRADPGASAQRC